MNTTLNTILISIVIHTSLCFKTNTKTEDRPVLQSLFSALTDTKVKKNALIIEILFPIILALCHMSH